MRLRMQEVALDLFSKKGYRSTSTRDVASLLGVQQASLYYHIKNKEELLHGICYNSFTHLVQKAEASVAASNDPLDRVHRILRNHLTITLKFQREFVISNQECRELSADYRAEIENLWQRYRRLIFATLDEAKEAGIVRTDVSNRYLFTAMMDMLNWTVIWFNPAKSLSVAELNQIFELIYFGGAANPSAHAACRAQSTHAGTGTLSDLVAVVPPAGMSETHAKLLDAACTLFKSKGYFATSVREIADVCGLQKASLYHYISGKEDLIYQLSKASLENISLGVRSALATADTPMTRIHTLIVCHVVCLLQHQNWYEAAHDELHALADQRRAEIVALRDGYEQLLRETLAEGQAAGILRKDVSAKFMGLVLLGLINCIYPWYQPEIDLTPSELGCLLADLFLYGVQAGAQLSAA